MTPTPHTQSVDEKCEHEVVRKHCFNCRFIEKYGMKIEMFNGHHFVRLKAVEKTITAARQQAREEALREVEDMFERLPCHSHGGTLSDGRIPAAILVSDILQMFEQLQSNHHHE